MEFFVIIFVLVVLVAPLVAVVMVSNLKGRVISLEDEVRRLKAGQRYPTPHTQPHSQPHVSTPIVSRPASVAEAEAPKDVEEIVETPVAQEAPVSEPPVIEQPASPTAPPADDEAALDEDQALADDLRARYAALVASGAVPPLQSDKEDAQIDEMAAVLENLPAAEAPYETARIPDTEPVSSTPATPAPPEKSGFVFSFEDLFGRRLPIWAGGITLAIAGVLIVKYAIDAGWLTPWIRIMGGLLFGGGLIAGAEYVYRKEAFVDDPRVRQALSGAGIATLYASILMAHNVYGLIGPVGAFAAMALITAAALGLSLRFGAPSALLGLAGGLATPALVGSMQPNVPLLSAYLALTVGGLTAVSRRQKWMWLGVAALAGGGVWSFILIVTDALAPANAIAIALLILVMAIVLPLFGFTHLGTSSTRRAIFRMIAAIIGASQIAVLVALGGFTMLHWSLFILIAAACQWLVWRERSSEDGHALFAMLPFASLILSVMLLLGWPNPGMAELGIISGILLLLHAVPLYPRIWSDDKDYPAFQWAVIGGGVFLVTMRHFADLPGFTRDIPTGLLLLGGSLLTLAPIVTGWSKVRTLASEAPLDIRLPSLMLVSGFIATVAACFLLPAWTIPLAAGAIAIAMLELVRRAGNPTAALPIPALAAAASFALLAVTPTGWDEFPALFGMVEAPSAQSVIRWGVLALVFAVFAARARPTLQQRASGAIAALLGYGTIAQFISPTFLPLVPAVGLLALTLVAARRQSELHPAIPAAQLTLVAIAIAWAAESIAMWVDFSMAALIGVALDLTALPTVMQSLTHLAIPVLLAGISLWLTRPLYAAQIDGNRLVRQSLRIVSALLIVTLLIAAHILYRHIFAASMGDDFVATGMAQRALWAAILLGLGWILIRRGDRLLPDDAPLWIAPAAGAAYLGYYSYILHNPLWNEQAVGAIPVANILLPTFALMMGALWLTEKEATSPTPAILNSTSPTLATRIIDVLRILAIILFSYQSLAQLFHGSMLYPTSVSEAENIMRSILAIALAIGFLLWGIRAKKRDWRIASLILMILAVSKVFLVDASGLTGLVRIGSFVALGFSLIGIGWLYSRQLRSEPKEESAKVGDTPKA